MGCSPQEPTFTHAFDATSTLFIDCVFMRCSRSRLTDPSQCIKSGWIWPADLAVYEEIRSTSFKSLKRGIPSAERLRVKTYGERRFDGNSAELLLLPGEANVVQDRWAQGSFAEKAARFRPLGSAVPQFFHPLPAPTSSISLGAISVKGRMKSTSPVLIEVSGMLKSCDVGRS